MENVASLQPPVWCWVNVPPEMRPQAIGPGRYSRPLARRDQVVAAAFGKEVRRLREEAGLSTAGLAQIVGVSQPTIIKIETDCTANIEMRVMFDLADAFGVMPSYFSRICEKAVSEEIEQLYQQSLKRRKRRTAQQSKEE